MTEILDETTERETETETETEIPSEGGSEAEPEEGEPEPEPAPEPPAAQGVSEQELEKFFKGLATRTATLNRWIEGEMGEDYANLSPCPLCTDGIVGHIYPPEWITPTNELQTRLLDVLKTPTAPEYRQAPHARRCGTCDGWGAVLSGSRLAGNERVKCPTCNGLGYQGQGVPAQTEHTGNGVVAFEPPDDQTPLVTDDTDIWGSPKLLPDGQPNPNYGKMVQYKDPTLP